MGGRLAAGRLAEAQKAAQGQLLRGYKSEASLHQQRLYSRRAASLPSLPHPGRSARLPAAPARRAPGCRHSRSAPGASCAAARRAAALLPGPPAGQRRRRTGPAGARGGRLLRHGRAEAAETQLGASTAGSYQCGQGCHITSTAGQPPPRPAWIQPRTHTHPPAPWPTGPGRAAAPLASPASRSRTAPHGRSPAGCPPPAAAARQSRRHCHPRPALGGRRPPARRRTPAAGEQFVCFGAQCSRRKPSAGPPGGARQHCARQAREPTGCCRGRRHGPPGTNLLPTPLQGQHSCRRARHCEGVHSGRSILLAPRAWAKLVMKGSEPKVAQRLTRSNPPSPSPAPPPPRWNMRDSRERTPAGTRQKGQRAGGGGGGARVKSPAGANLVGGSRCGWPGVPRRSRRSRELHSRGFWPHHTSRRKHKHIDPVITSTTDRRQP